MSDPRLHSIYMAAGRLFNRRGYADTKVSEIAAEAGIATGSVYNLFTGKKSILTFVIRASLETGYLDSDMALPIEEADSSLLMRLWKQAYDKIANHILKITGPDGTINRSFVQMVSDLFDMSADYLLAFGNIERNADLLRELADAFLPARIEAFVTVEKNLKLYEEAGEIRKIDYSLVHVQSILDILTWWAMNAYIAMPEVSVPREIAKKIAVDLLSHAYLKKYE